MGCFGSLQGKKSPDRRFFNVFLREAQQTPSLETALLQIL
jgi:hypothetical protein